jgi:hypothetical protein
MQEHTNQVLEYLRLCSVLFATLARTRRVRASQFRYPAVYVMQVHIKLDQDQSIQCNVHSVISAHIRLEAVPLPQLFAPFAMLARTRLDLVQLNPCDACFVMRDPIKLARAYSPLRFALCATLVHTRQAQE